MVSSRTLRSGPHPLLLALLLGLPLLALVPVQTEKYEALWLAASNAGHLPLFGLFATGIFFALPHRLGRRPGRYVATVAISFLTVICIEVVQVWFSRTPSFEDAVIGMLGVALALGGISVWRRQTARVLRLAYAGLTVLILLWLFGPAWNEARVLIWSTQRFPVLGDFEERIELRLWRGQNDPEGERTSVSLSEAYASSGRQSLKVRTGWGSWNGVRYNPGRLADWQRFGELRFEVYNPGRPFHLKLRVKDAERDGSDTKFTREFDMQSGWNNIRVHLDDIRAGGPTPGINLSEITQLAIYTGEHEPGRVFFVDHVRLVNLAPGRKGKAAWNVSR